MTRVVLVFGIALALVGCTTVASGPDAPWTGPLRFTPPSFSIGQSTKLSFEYRNVRGGLTKSQVELDFQGSRPGDSRKASTFADLIKVLGGTSETAVFETELRLAPSGSPPFDITYYLRIKDAEGRRSNEAVGSVTFRPL